MTRNGAATLLALAAAMATGCTPAERNEDGRIAVAGAVDAFSIRVGDCYDNAMFFSDEIADVAGVPCGNPHDNEVFALFDLELDDYPGADRTLELADEGCLDRFEGYVGTTYDESALMITTLVPSKGSWHQIHDREVVCVTYHMELEKLTGSVRATGL